MLCLNLSKNGSKPGTANDKWKAPELIISISLAKREVLLGEVETQLALRKISASSGAMLSVV
jgi:hypothetical protein